MTVSVIHLSRFRLQFSTVLTFCPFEVIPMSVFSQELIQRMLMELVTASLSRFVQTNDACSDAQSES